MNIPLLKIQNFLTIGNAKLFLKNKGLVLIQGINEDDSSAVSNGSGKSSIVDALCWCIYGETARSISGDAVVNRTNKKDCFVETHIEDGDILYQIIRYRKDKIFKNQTVVKSTSGTSGIWIDLSKGTEKDTQEVIVGIMGCELEVFRAAIYAGQEDAINLPCQTDKQLKLLIEESAGVSRLEGAYAAARLKLNEAAGQVAMRRGKLTDYENMLISNKTNHESAEESFNKFEGERKNKTLNSQKIVNDLDAQKLKLIGTFNSEFDPIFEVKIKEIDDELASNSAKVKTQNGYEKACFGLEQDQLQITRQAKLDRDVAMTLKKNLENAAEISKKPCTSCGKPGDEHDLTTYKEHVTANLKAALERAIKSKGEAEKTLAYAKKVRKETDELAAKIPDVSELCKRRAKFAGIVDGYNKTKADIAKYEEVIDRESKIGNGYATEANPCASVWSHIINEAVDLKMNAVICEGSLAVAEEALALYTNVVQVFGPAGVRAHILDTVTPFLNERTADYLSALSDGNITAVWSTLTKTAKGDLKEKFNIEVSNDKGAESFAGLSGGEKRKVRLSTMLALQDLVASRATKNIELFIADEVDDALDPAGLERLMGVLDRKAKDRGTVLVISHNDLESWIPNVCTVTKKDGLSTIDGALS